MSGCDKLVNYVRYNDVVYRLLGYLVSDIDDARYPRFDIFLNEEILFRSLSEAEAKIHELASLDEHIGARAYFFIHEIPIGTICYHSYGQRVRSYTADGKFYAETKASLVEDINGNLEPFYGRESNECHFKPGDIVEVFRGDEVTLEVVQLCPIDPSFISQRYSNPMSADYIHPDFTDDSYVTLSWDEGGECCHDHPSVVCCFPACTLPQVPSHILDTLKKAYARYSVQIQ